MTGLGESMDSMTDLGDCGGGIADLVEWGLLSRSGRERAGRMEDLGERG